MTPEHKIQPNNPERPRPHNRLRDTLKLAALPVAIATAAALIPESAFAADGIHKFSGETLVGDILSGAAIGGIFGWFTRCLHRRYVSIRQFEEQYGLQFYRIHSNPLIFTHMGAGAIGGAISTLIWYLQ